MRNPTRSRMEGEQFDKFQEHAADLARTDIAKEIEDERAEQRRKIAKEWGDATLMTNNEPLSKAQLTPKKNDAKRK